MMIYEKPRAEVISFETENVMLTADDLENEPLVDISQGIEDW